MKKFFTLFAAALLGLGAFAQDFDPTEGCQTWMSLYRTNSDAAKVEIEVQVKNLVNNMNSFDLLLQKSSDAMNWKNIKGTKKFSCEGYEAVILSELTEVDGEAIDDDGRELAQTHVHKVGDPIQISHPMSFPSSAFNLSQHQGLLQ